MAYTNPNCDGSGPCSRGVVRVLPLGKDSNAILCYRDYLREIVWRRNQNTKVVSWERFNLPDWEKLDVYVVDDADQALCIHPVTVSGETPDGICGKPKGHQWHWALGAWEHPYMGPHKHDPTCAPLKDERNPNPGHCLAGFPL